MGQYLIDTNIISDYLLASLPSNGLQFMDNIIDAVPNFSVISQIELLCWKTDAATAMAYDLTLVTNNEKDFANIGGLKIINPFKL